MQNSIVPSTAEVVAFLREAADQGRIVVLPAARSVSPESALVATCRLVFDLTRIEARALLQLLGQPHAAREELHAAIIGNGIATTQIKLVDVVVCRLRKKLVPHGIKINTIRGFGFSIEAATRDRIRKLLSEHGGDAVTTPSEEAHG